jgi:signal transduction histidine kinase
VRRQADELRASRARIVEATDAERRRIERDLHDGAQQHLVALAVSVRLTRQIADSDTEAAKEMLDQIGSDLQEAVQELRNLAHGIYPPLLMDAGLGDALHAAAQRAPQPVATNVDVARHGTEIEAAVYFCCLEALQNAAKHAPDAEVEVRVWDDGDCLRFVVADDGPGFDRTAVTAGHGFQNMADRLGAIGGSVTWDAAPGRGTRVMGTVPTGARADTVPTGAKTNAVPT